MDCLVDKYSKQSLEQIVRTSKSMAELVKKLGHKTTHGKNYKTVQKRLDEFNISTDHFKQIKSNKVFTEADVFCKNSQVGQHTLRRFYLKNKNIDYQCSICKTPPVWNDKELTLQLDHIDGDNTNNEPSNLRWLCPNCHSQTRTFAGKNVKKERRHYYCIDCGKEISSNASKCIQCSGKDRQKEICVPKEELLSLLQLHKGNFTHIGKMFDVSDNAVRKWCNTYGLPIHSFDYREKKPAKVTKPKSDQYKPCYMIDKETNEILMEFESRSAAEEYLKIPKAAIHIAHVCEGKRSSAYGFKWMDKDSDKLVS